MISVNARSSGPSFAKTRLSSIFTSRMLYFRRKRNSSPAGSLLLRGTWQRGKDRLQQALVVPTTIATCFPHQYNSMTPLINRERMHWCSATFSVQRMITMSVWMWTDKRHLVLISCSAWLRHILQFRFCSMLAPRCWTWRRIRSRSLGYPWPRG